MEITVLESNGNRIKLYIKGVPLHVLNSIRRVILSEVPTMAISTVVIVKNNTVFYDEYVAHRLGLIPLTSENALNKYKSPEECAKAEAAGYFTEDCFARFTLDYENNTDSYVTIYSGDMVASDPDVKPVHDKIPIIVLDRGQGVKFEAYARLGRGSEHAKWSPVSVAAHRYVADINVDYEKCRGIDCSKCVEACPKNVLEFRENKLVVRNDRKLDCSLCRVCEVVCPTRAISVSWIDNEYVFILESLGSLSIKTIFLKSIEILENKIDELWNKLVETGVLS
ncbi:MAG: DNA-directed RNA polymerase subunit D [Desulfurococcaceae archaeon]